jgi:hypothetical protein
MKRDPNAYHAVLNPSFRVTPTERDFLSRRTMPFLDRHALETRTLETILQEVYMQGMRDTLEALK